MNYTDSQPSSESTKRSAEFPAWLKRPIAHSGRQNAVHDNIHSLGLHTVCKEAKCPNRSECYSKGTATFLILGSICTRNCTFCGVTHGTPQPIDTSEPSKVVTAIKTLKLRHVVLTSVTRDDLTDGGASIYAQTISLIRNALPNITIEVLVPDFKGERDALQKVFASKPDIFNHNVETVPRLYQQIRPQAQYDRSLDVLTFAAKNKLIVKSGIMVGLGEDVDEVQKVIKDIFSTGSSILTIGQYLQPSKSQTPVVEFITPERFLEYEKFASSLGFSNVFAGPFIRSSYMAEEVFKNIQH